MVQTLQHRGPDAQGILLQENVALGHTRLAIIGLSDGVQPMRSCDGIASIVFNGEIYNYKELKNDLLGRGCRFVTHSDTEVILQLYQKEGWPGFSRLRGMYAFAIWDNRKQTGLLVRDPIGIKPLFYSDTNNEELIFASEAKAILAAGHSVELDECALHLLMNFRYLPGDRSLFNGIRQLSPGAILEWGLDRPIREYTIASPRLTRHIQPLDALQESVKVHLTADVEVATYLSGGIDSATITALATAYRKNELRTFTLDVGDDPREAEYAARTAEILGVGNLQDDSTENIAEALPKLIWHLELPKVNSWQVAELAKQAAQRVKVVLSGLGGDELFLGYPIHRILYLCDSLHRVLPTWLGKPMGDFATQIVSLASPTPWTEAERTCRILAALGNWAQVYGLLRNLWDSPKLRRLIYGPRMLDSALPNAFTVIEENWPDNSDPVEAAAEFEWRQKMVNDLLWQEDRCSMAVGLEVRVPFLDLPLAKSVHSLGRRQLMPNGKCKGFMQEILMGILPPEIMNRKKSGFQVDSPRFFKQYLDPLADKWLNEDVVRQHGLFNPRFISQVRQSSARKGLRWHFFMLYLMLGTHIWIDQFQNHQWNTEN